MQELAKKFWFGKITLWKSYWLVGELLNGLFILCIFNLEIYLFKNNNLITQLPFFYFNNFNIISKILVIGWTIFVTVGIWRSAENYKGNLVWIILAFLFLSYRIFSLRLILFT